MRLKIKGGFYLSIEENLGHLYSRAASIQDNTVHIGPARSG